MARWHCRSVGGAWAALAAAMLCAACSAPTTADGVADAGSEAAPSDAGGSVNPGWTPHGVLPAWDPVWHLTAERVWPQKTDVPVEDCGGGCSWIFDRIDPGWFVASVTRSAAIDGAVELLHRRTGDVAERVISEPGERTLFAYLSTDGAYTVFRSGETWKTLPINIVLMNVVTGERKTLWTDSQDSPGEVAYVGVNRKYAFWAIEGAGLARRDLATGEAMLLGGVPDCEWGWCVGESVLVCMDSSGVIGIDVETGKRRVTDVGHGLQMSSACSASRTQVALTDDRATGGGVTSIDGQLNGSEVYVLDVPSWTMKRRTTEPPGVVRLKYRPVVDGDNIAWMEPGVGSDPNPRRLGDLQRGSLVTFDPVSGAKCRVDREPLHEFFPLAMRGRHVIGQWTNPKSSNADVHLVDLNLDDPSLSWTCEPVQ